MKTIRDKILNELSLGNDTVYLQEYSPFLLKGVPRTIGRKALNINQESSSFHGDDIWTLYELSWLNTNGIPQVAIGEVLFNCQNKNIIESKSAKLYLNSLNQSKFDSWGEVKNIIKNDFSKCADGDVNITLFKTEELEGRVIGKLPGHCIDNQNIVIKNFKFSEKYLFNSTQGIYVKETLVSHIFKSNCLITNQPDWGSVQIEYSGKKIDRSALLRYLISFRQHNEFHEQCVERIYYDIMKYFNPKKLTVYARYTRRGGIDINPWRSNTDFFPMKERLSRQ